MRLLSTPIGATPCGLTNGVTAVGRLGTAAIGYSWHEAKAVREPFFAYGFKWLPAFVIVLALKHNC